MNLIFILKWAWVVLLLFRVLLLLLIFKCRSRIWIAYIIIRTTWRDIFSLLVSSCILAGIIVLLFKIFMITKIVTFHIHTSCTASLRIIMLMMRFSLLISWFSFLLLVMVSRSGNCTLRNWTFSLLDAWLSWLVIWLGCRRSNASFRKSLIRREAL